MIDFAGEIKHASLKCCCSLPYESAILSITIAPVLVAIFSASLQIESLLLCYQTS